MRPLTFRVQTERLTEARILKVVDADEFVSQGWPPERSMLLIDRCPAPLQSSLASLRWGAFFRDTGVSTDGNVPEVRCATVKDAVSVGDVVEVIPSRSRTRVLYRRGEVGNILFATERCNSYCLMCSQPPREVDDRWRIQQSIDLISLIDRDEPSLAITGGEPTLLGSGLVDIINACAVGLPRTDLQVLTNGRAFAQVHMASTLSRVEHPLLQWNVPLYADVASVHDYVVQAKGAFRETLDGLHALAAAGMAVEIRVVLHRPTVARLTALAKFIYRNLTFARHVAFMGIESIGFARANREALWIDPLDYVDTLAEATQFLAERGMRVSLYNLPLCVLPHSLWPFAAKSISTWKNDFLPQCAECSVRDRCGGFFASLTEEWTSRGIRPLRGEEALNGFVS